MSGYTQTELDDIQAKWNLRFPPDLCALYRERRRVIDMGDKFRSHDWLEDSDEILADLLNWPLEGFLFDVRQGLWWPEWGELPVKLDQVEEKFRDIFAQAPKLVPVFGHRYIPEEPGECGNPIFSVWQMDVVYYGVDLNDYIAHETLRRPLDSIMPSPKKIAFWSRAVEFNEERFDGGGSFKFFNKGGVLPEQ
jgi:hypothetical protein